MSFKKLKRRLSLLLATVMVANSNTFVVNAGEAKYLGENKDNVTSGQAITDDVVSSQSLSVDVVEEKDFEIQFKVNSDWGNGFTGEIIVKNNSDKAVENWFLDFDFANNIDSIWNGVIAEHTDKHYKISNAGYNNNIGPKSSVSIGFNGNPGLINTEPENYVLSYDGGSFSLATDESDSVISSDDKVIDVENAEIFNFNNKKYALFEESKTWEDAQNYCEGIGGHLVTINSEEENDFILNTVLTTAKKSNYWIGGTDKNSEGNWVWVTGEEFNYTNWKTGQPDNSNDEDYLHIIKKQEIGMIIGMMVLY